MTRRHVRLLQLTAMAALVSAGVVSISPAALAHTDLVSSTPAAGATLAEPPRQVALQFTEAIAGEFAAVSLTVDGGAARRLRAAGEAQESDIVTVRVPADAGPGAWRVGYRVTSADGHPIQGTLDFEVTAPAASSASPSPSLSTAPTATPSPPAARAGDAAATPTPSSSPAGGSALLAVLAAGLLMVLAIGVFVVRGARRRGIEDLR